MKPNLAYHCHDACTYRTAGEYCSATHVVRGSFGNRHAAGATSLHGLVLAFLV